MMTRHQLARVRRQMHRRIRMTLAQRRVDAHLADDPTTDPDPATDQRKAA